MKTLFILGRNPKLSIEEIKSYFEKTKNPILSIQLNKNAIIAETKKSPEKNIIEQFGGVIAIGKILAQGKFKEIISELEKQEVYYGTENKLNYIIWNFSRNTFKLSEYLNKRFRKERLKATEKRLTGQIQLQSGERIPNLQSKLIDEQYFVFNDTKRDYFGKITEKVNYQEIEKRDMEKPVRRSSLSISPRLAKIMINLAQINPKETLVDPFCGIGVILGEALLQNINAIGIDQDKDAIDGARKNLNWQKFNSQNYLLINNDSTKVRIKPAMAMATEPDFGNILKKRIPQHKAQQQIQQFENLIINVLNNMKNYVNKKFVFTSPFIKVAKNQRIGCNINNILEKTKLNLVKDFPIEEFRPGQPVGREIYVLEK